METYFLTNSSFLLLETDFLSSENSVLPYKALLEFLKFGGSNFFKEKPYTRGNWFSGLWKFFNFLDTPASETYFSPSGNIVLNEFFIPYGEDGGKTLFPQEERDILSGGNCFLLIRASFLRVETVSETCWNKKGCTFYPNI